MDALDPFEYDMIHTFIYEDGRRLAMLRPCNRRMHDRCGAYPVTHLPR